jgi:hypothetical protein
MSTNPRHRKYHRKRIIAYIILLGIFGFAVYFFNLYIISTGPLFVSPIGKSGVSQTAVGKILKDNGIPFKSVVFSDYFLVTIRDNEQVKLSSDKDIRRQVASLQKILRELTIEGKSFKSIDFRFSEPIISF